MSEAKIQILRKTEEREIVLHRRIAEKEIRIAKEEIGERMITIIKEKQ